MYFKYVVFDMNTCTYNVGSVLSSITIVVSFNMILCYTYRYIRITIRYLILFIIVYFVLQMYMNHMYVYAPYRGVIKGGG